MKYYTLENLKPAPCKDVLDWCVWMEANQQRVIVATKTILLDTDDECVISTIFTGVDHLHLDPEIAEPYLFESLVICPISEDVHFISERFLTYQDALKGHQEIVDNVTRVLIDQGLLSD